MCQRRGVTSARVRAVRPARCPDAVSPGAPRAINQLLHHLRKRENHFRLCQRGRWEWSSLVSSMSLRRGPDGCSNRRA